ncbi:MAG: hypothetical protein ACKVQQ_16480 [Burkholderiales bacterium]
MPKNANDADDEMPAEIDFSQGTRGKFFRTDAKLHLPVYLDDEVLAWLAALASKKGVQVSDIANSLLRKEIELIESTR